MLRKSNFKFLSSSLGTVLSKGADMATARASLTSLQLSAKYISNTNSLSESSNVHSNLCFGSQFFSGSKARNFSKVTDKNALKTKFNEGVQKFQIRAKSTAVQPSKIENVAPIDWDDLGFGLTETDFMYVLKYDNDGWKEGELLPYGNLSLSPSAGVLNYGQGVFEGMKAYRTEDDRLLIFRPMENAKRLIESAERMCMPSPSPETFLSAVKQLVSSNRRWIPPPGKGSLYIRPLLIGSGPILGLAPAPEYTFLIYCSPVGNYFKGGTLKPIDLKVEEVYHRAAPGGTGSAKTISNYAPVLKTQLTAKKEGYSDVLYLDAVENKYLEEVSSCNIFVIKGNQISTPELKGTILPGITRKSIIELARSFGHEVLERPVDVNELEEADEVFCTGTAVVVSPVGKITYRDKTTTYSEGKVGPIAQKLYTALTELQMGKSEDAMGWTMEVK